MNDTQPIKERLNQKGQCPVCLIKPLVYKGRGLKFCHRCNRQFDLDTGEFEPNFHWIGFNELKSNPTQPK